MGQAVDKVVTHGVLFVGRCEVNGWNDDDLLGVVCDGATVVGWGDGDGKSVTKVTELGDMLAGHDGDGT